MGQGKGGRASIASVKEETLHPLCKLVDSSLWEAAYRKLIKDPICYQPFHSNGLCLPHLVPFYFLVSKSLLEIRITNELLKKFTSTHISGVTCTFHSILFFFFTQFFFFPSVLSTVITLFYIRSLDFIHHITGSLQSFTILSLFPTLTPEYHHSILFLWI